MRFASLTLLSIAVGLATRPSAIYVRVYVQLRIYFTKYLFCLGFS